MKEVEEGRGKKKIYELYQTDERNSLREERQNLDHTIRDSERR